MTRIHWTALILLLIGIDQWSKWLVETQLPLYERIAFLPFFSFFRTYNEGVAFSALSGLGPWPLIVMTGAIIAFVLWLWNKTAADRPLSAIGFALVLSGAFGNLIDRVRLGKVIDMLSFHIDSIGFQFAIFNLADTFITLGAAAIILDEVLVWRKNRNETGKNTRQEAAPDQKVGQDE